MNKFRLGRQALLAASYSMLFIASSQTVQAAGLGANEFNPAMSLILDGKFADYQLDPEAYSLPGFAPGPEAHPAEAGLSVQHTELVLSANVDDLFYGSVTAAIASHEGATEVEMEEAFVETLGLGNGLTVKVGRFLSGLGYLNSQHAHAWDFADAPLVYRGLFGNQLGDDGVQLRWVAPTDIYLQLGAEVLRGEGFPGGGTEHGRDARTLFVKLGGDVGVSHSWQLGLSRWRADVGGRVTVDEATGDETTFAGTSAVNAVDLVWKWAPAGNVRERNLKLQMEYLQRDEDGDVTYSAAGSTTYRGKQHGGYAQAVYQFHPQWRAGVRYDRLGSDNTGSDATVLAAANLADADYTPKRTSVMVDYSRSEFSRLRLQLNRDESTGEADRHIYLQYVMSLGAHGAHSF
jgi:hypothetical protein